MCWLTGPFSCNNRGRNSFDEASLCWPQVLLPDCGGRGSVLLVTGYPASWEQLVPTITSRADLHWGLWSSHGVAGLALSPSTCFVYLVVVVTSAFSSKPSLASQVTGGHCIVPKPRGG